MHIRSQWLAIVERQTVAFAVLGGAVFGCFTGDADCLCFSLDTAKLNHFLVVAWNERFESDVDLCVAVFKQSGGADDKCAVAQALHSSLTVVGEVGGGDGDGLLLLFASLAGERSQTFAVGYNHWRIFRIPSDTCGCKTSVECAHRAFKIDACGVLAYSLWFVGEGDSGFAAASRNSFGRNLKLVAVGTSEVNVDRIFQVCVFHSVGGESGV